MESNKRSLPSPTGDIAHKRTRKLCLQTKMEILQRLTNGETASALGRAYNVNESSVRLIRRNAGTLKMSVQNSSDLSLKTTHHTRNPFLEKTEVMLSMWIEDKIQNCVPLSSHIIREKALKIYNHLVQEQGELPANSAFQASKGWFNKFKRRQGLQNIKFTGEIISAYPEETNVAFPEQLKQIIQSGGYTAQQVFNMNETGLFWKRLPPRTFISTEEKQITGFKPSQDRLTLMLCGNAAGDFKCKPLLVYHSQNPRALTGVSLHTLPVHWRSNKKAWVTSDITEDWLVNCFSREVEQYCHALNLTFRALLIIDNAPGHPSYLSDLNPNIQVVFLPPNTSSFLQPLDQGVITNFKLLYLRQTLLRLHNEIDNPNKTSVLQFWKRYNIRHALENIRDAWDSVSIETVNSSWKVLWSECVKDFEESDRKNDDIAYIMNLGRQVGFNELEETDIQELLESHDEELEEDELEQLFQEQQKEEKMVGYGNLEQRELTLKNLSKLLEMSNQLTQFGLEIDPNMDRSLKMKRMVKEAVAVYQDMYEQKKKTKQLNSTQCGLVASTSSTSPISFNIEPTLPLFLMPAVNTEAGDIYVTPT